MWESACGWARQRLALLAGGELTGNDRRKTERHLIVCGDCRTRLESFSAALGALRGLALADNTASASPSLWPALARQIRESKHVEPKVFAFRPMWMGLAMAAGVLIVGTTTWSIVNVRDSSGSKLIAAKKPVQSRIPAVKPIATETSSATTIAEASPTNKSEGESISSSTTGSAKLPSNGRIGIEPTH